MRSFALIGFGYWGQRLARNMHDVGILKVVCDVDESALLRGRENFLDVDFVGDYKSILNDDEIKGVFIAVPAPLHYAVAYDCLVAGKDVFVEKPLSMSFREGKELVFLAKDTGRILMVGHTFLYHPCVQQLQKMVDGGELGVLKHAISTRLNFGRFRKDENALWTLAPHDLSIILFLCRYKNHEKISYSAASDDVASLNMTFRDGFQAYINVSRMNPFRERRLTVVGSKGMAVFDSEKPWKEKLVFYSVEDCSPRAIAVPAIEPLREECLHFVDCCLTRKQPLTHGETGLQVLALLEEAEKTIR